MTKAEIVELVFRETLSQFDTKEPLGEILEFARGRTIALTLPGRDRGDVWDSVKRRIRAWTP